jgi:hypothetical protein
LIYLIKEENNMPYLADGTYISDAQAQEMEDKASRGGMGGLYGQIMGQLTFTNNPTVAPTAQEMATASPEEMKAIIEQFGMEGYEKYFAQFDQAEIDAIKENFENQMGQLDLKSKGIAEQVKGKLTGMGEQERTIASQRGFAGSGDLSQKFAQDKSNMFRTSDIKMKDLSSRADLSLQGVDLERESAELGQTEGIRSAYKAYEDKFYSQMANVESMRDSGGDSGGKK